MKRGAPQALEVKRVSKKLAETEPSSAPRLEETTPEATAAASCKLLRACASQNTGSLQKVLDALEAGAEVDARDVTGQNPLVVSALNMRGAEKKCKLLIQHRADVHQPAVAGGSQSTLDWAKERINASFAAFLEALSKGEEADLAMLLDAPAPEEF
ncbi:unnamed protein product [Effrenium voratum]|uniref:Ankyrin repeat domain-containing protein n=1 Tax=Effrenium voratum TaxID=2562239 RepID=A0AA36J825_9DINO|nr:unnamed protein product [Effrenium voratum]CAJ1460892.1 unnamed protein product [Effrenium voratum]